ANDLKFIRTVWSLRKGTHTPRHRRAEKRCIRAFSMQTVCFRAVTAASWCVSHIHEKRRGPHGCGCTFCGGGTGRMNPQTGAARVRVCVFQTFNERWIHVSRHNQIITQLCTHHDG
ncbi:unnamed protein product, partial [Ectocarpus sp. 8 AP-2014]